jgi:hypothetical protein
VEAFMLIRISITVALTVGLLLAAIGVLVAPGAAFTGVAFALLVAAGTATYARENPDSRAAAASRSGRRAGLTAGGGTLAVWLPLTGLVALLGPASGIILVSALMPASVLWLWWRAPDRFASWTAVGGSRRPPPAPVAPAELSTPDLCLAWQRTQRTLLEPLTAPARFEIVSARQQLLDEMERRDSAGFHRWLATGACGGTDPNRYLIID